MSLHKGTLLLDIVYENIVIVSVVHSSISMLLKSSPTGMTIDTLHNLS